MLAGNLPHRKASPPPRLAAALVALASSGALGAGCAPSANDLEVGAGIQDVSFTVTRAPLGTQIEGTFTLKLTLGQLASSGSDVAIQSFALLRAADGMPLDAPLDVGASAPRSIHVDIGMSQLVVFKVAPHLVMADKMAQLCAGAVEVTGAVLDGARGKTTPVAGPSFAVSGCGP